MRVPEVLVSLRQSHNVLIDEVCNATEVHVKQPYWLGCGRSAELSSRGMSEEMHQLLLADGSLREPEVFRMDAVGKLSQKQGQR